MQAANRKIVYGWQCTSCDEQGRVQAEVHMSGKHCDVRVYLDGETVSILPSNIHAPPFSLQPTVNERLDSNGLSMSRSIITQG